MPFITLTHIRVHVNLLWCRVPSSWPQEIQFFKDNCSMQAKVTKQRNKWDAIGQSQEKKQIVGTNVHQKLKLSGFLTVL